MLFNYMTKKKIQLNPNYFILGGKKNKTVKNKRQKKQKKVKPSTLVKPSKIRKQLLLKIKEHQERNRLKNSENLNNENEFNENNNFEDEFRKSLNYLKDVVKKSKTLKNQQALQLSKQPITINNQPIQLNKPSTIQIHHEPIQLNNQVQQQNSNLVKINLVNTQSKQPPYSCLKGGSRPTFRQWQKTLKTPITIKNEKEKESISINNTLENKEQTLNNNLNNNDIIQRKQLLEKIKILHNKNENNERINKNKNKNVIKIKRKTKTIKHRVGKIKNNTGKYVSFLLKNRETRKKINTEKNLLSRKRIPEMKQYLRQKNLIKVGSSAPDSIIREMYVNSILTGDLNNENEENLIHNYINER